MLDDVTKKRINTLRQILVGKLPDPKAQVEQITNGLIYKFMNDMDEQSVSMGGKSTYFSGKFQKYSERTAQVLSKTMLRTTQLCLILDL